MRTWLTGPPALRHLHSPCCGKAICCSVSLLLAPWTAKLVSTCCTATHHLSHYSLAAFREWV